MLCLAALAAPAALAVPGHGARTHRELRPDLQPEPPAALTISEEGPPTARRYLLGFRSATVNVGRGPLLVEGRRAAGRRTMIARQLVRRSGTRARVVVNRVGRLRYVRGYGHAHWHLLGFMRYELRRAGEGQALVADHKSGFCLGDRFRIHGPPSAAAPDQPQHVGSCGPGLPGLRAVREGISVGYGDDYPPYIEGQSLDITGLPAGRYELIHRVNADRALRETDYSDNRSSVTFTLTLEAGVPRLEPVPVIAY